jgi:hypothetical protein
LKRGVTVVQNGATFTSVRFPSDDDLQAADNYWLGGHVHVIDSATATALTTAGYGAYIATVDDPPAEPEPPAPPIEEDRMPDFFYTDTASLASAPADTLSTFDPATYDGDIESGTTGVFTERVTPSVEGGWDVAQANAVDGNFTFEATVTTPASLTDIEFQVVVDGAIAANQSVLTKRLPKAGLLDATNKVKFTIPYTDRLPVDAHIMPAIKAFGSALSNVSCSVNLQGWLI